MHTNLAPSFEEGQTACEKCGSAVWRARFGKGHDVRLVERAPKFHTVVGRMLRHRSVGHIALTFPLRGMGGEILGAVTRRLTDYRLHGCRAFSAPTGRKCLIVGGGAL